jgi:hypothetical protein
VDTSDFSALLLGLLGVLAHSDSKPPHHNGGGDRHHAEQPTHASLQRSRGFDAEPTILRGLIDGLVEPSGGTARLPTAPRRAPPV